MALRPSIRSTLTLRGTASERVSALRAAYRNRQGTIAVPIGFPPRLEQVPRIQPLQMQALLEEINRLAKRHWSGIGQRPGPLDQDLATMRAKELQGDLAYAGIAWFHDRWLPGHRKLVALADANRITPAELGEFWTLVHDFGFFLDRHQKHVPDLTTDPARRHPRISSRWTFQAPKTPTKPAPQPKPRPKPKPPQPKPRPRSTTPSTTPTTPGAPSTSLVPLLMLGALALLFTR